MNFQKLNIADLHPAEYNPRKDLKPADSEYQKIKRSIEEFGYVDPVIVNVDMTVIGGHQRVKVLKDLGYDEIDCVVLDIDKEQEKALNIALNKISGATLLVMKPGSDRKYVIQMYFLPEELLEQRVKEDKIPYDKWHDRGLLRLCSGNKVNYSDVTEWYIEMFQQYGIRPLWNYYDPWNSRYWVQEMEETGFEMIECRQGSKTLSQPMKEMEADLKAHNINYNNNPVLKWCLTNTSIERDKNDNIRPIKGKNSRLRIDGTVSLLIAYCALFERMADYKAMI